MAKNGNNANIHQLKDKLSVVHLYNEIVSDSKNDVLMHV